MSTCWWRRGAEAARHVSLFLVEFCRRRVLAPHNVAKWATSIVNKTALAATRLDRSDAPLLLLLALIDTAPESVRPVNAAGAGANSRFNAGSADQEHRWVGVTPGVASGAGTGDGQTL